MPYRVKQDGTIEADTPEEALELARLLDRKKHGNWARRGDETPAEPKKSSTRRRSAPKTRTAAKNGRRPDKAVQYDVKLGQVYEKQSGKSANRVIQIDQLLKDGVMPKIVKDAPGITRKGVPKKLSYHVLHSAYRLIKDV
jgi:hypothetical protein